MTTQLKTAQTAESLPRQLARQNAPDSTNWEPLSDEQRRRSELEQLAIDIAAGR